MSEMLLCPLGAHRAVEESGIRTDKQSLCRNHVRMLWNHTGVINSSCIVGEGFTEEVTFE